MSEAPNKVKDLLCSVRVPSLNQDTFYIYADGTYGVNDSEKLSKWKIEDGSFYWYHEHYPYWSFYGSESVADQIREKRLSDTLVREIGFALAERHLLT